MDFRNGEIVEVTGEIYGMMTDPFGNSYYQVCFDNNVVVGVPKKIIRCKDTRKINYIETKEYKPGRFR